MNDRKAILRFKRNISVAVVLIVKHCYKWLFPSLTFNYKLLTWTLIIQSWFSNHDKQRMLHIA